jgi:hypothetical protein
MEYKIYCDHYNQKKVAQQIGRKIPIHYYLVSAVFENIALYNLLKGPYSIIPVPLRLVQDGFDF